MWGAYKDKGDTLSGGVIENNTAEVTPEFKYYKI